MSGEHKEPASHEWRWVALALVFVVAVPVITFLTRGQTGSVAVWLIAAQAVATGLAFLIPQARAVVGRRREEDAPEKTRSHPIIVTPQPFLR